MSKQNEDRELSDDLRKEAEKLGITPQTKKEEGSEEEKDEELEGDEEESEDEESEEETEEDEEEVDPKKSAESDESEESEEETEEEDDESEGEEEDEEESDESKDPKKPGKFIPLPKYQAEKAKQKVKEGTLLKTIADLQTEVEGLKKNQKPEPISPERQKHIDELKAVDKDFSEESFNKILDILKAEIVGSKGMISSELQAKIDAAEKLGEDLKKERAEKVDKEYFNKNWDKLSPTIAKEFPNLSAEQSAAAKKLMDDLWHTDKYSDKEIDYVYFKNKDKFSAIISPRKKGLETGGTLGNRSVQKQGAPKLGVNPGPKELANAEKVLNAAGEGEELEELSDELEETI